jgi:hypothetical protein
LKGELTFFSSQIQEKKMKKSPLAGGPLIDDPDVCGGSWSGPIFTPAIWAEINK